MRTVDAAAGRPTPVTAWLEYQHDADTSLELRTGESDVVNWIPRKRDGAALVDAMRDALTADTVSVVEDYFWCPARRPAHAPSSAPAQGHWCG
ncbi:hypothetical protein AHiyo4_48240 [Arthrobacter sp. Hiyo4]|nr:hypothetical protein AHiyo4_48240 [Arthrobacter sp. Hiyo4]